MHAIEKRSADRTHRRTFSIRTEPALPTMTATTIVKEKGKKRRNGTPALLFVPSSRKGGFTDFVQFTVEEYRERMPENQTTTRLKKRRQGEGVYSVRHSGREGGKRDGRNNVFILCAWLNVSRGSLLETHGSERERKKRKKRERERERRRQRDWNVSWSCE